MAKCTVQLNSTQVLLLKGEFGISDFAFKLYDYYQGRITEQPDIKELAHYIHNEVIPHYFNNKFIAQNTVNFLDTNFQSGVVNVNALIEALSAMFGRVAASNSQGLLNPDYVKKPGLVVNLVEQMAKDRLLKRNIRLTSTTKKKSLLTQLKSKPSIDNHYPNDWDYSAENWDDMYKDAFDGNPEAEWNID